MSQNNGVGCNHAQCCALFFALRTQQPRKYEAQYSLEYLSLLTEVCICRDNAVYRSNSFKFERRTPSVSDNPGGQQPVRESSHISHIIDQVIQTKKRNRLVRTKKEVILLRSILKVTACNCMDFFPNHFCQPGWFYIDGQKSGWNCGKQLTVSSDKNWENSAH